MTLYNNTIKTLYDDMRPIAEKDISIVDSAPWYNNDVCKKGKEAQRKLLAQAKDWRGKKMLQGGEK